MVRTGQSKLQPTFCDFIPIAGSKWFDYDPKNKSAHCKDADQAQIYASRWINKTYTGRLTAIDLNNVACAFLWRNDPDLEQARKLFAEASLKSLGKNQTIEDNKRKGDQMLSTVPQVGVPGMSIKKVKMGTGRVLVPARRPGISIREIEIPPAKPTARIGVPTVKNRNAPGKQVTNLTNKSKRIK